MELKARFVERQDSRQVVFDPDLICSRMCYGATLFANGYHAYANAVGVDVFDTNSTLVDEGLEDVFYFASGDSFKKMNAEDNWKFFRSDKMLVAFGVEVKVLSPYMAGIKTEDGVWQIYQLHDHITPKLLIEVADALDIKCHECRGVNSVLAVKSGEGIRLISLQKNEKGEYPSIDVNDYAVTHGSLFVVTQSKQVLSLKHNDSCSMMCCVKGVDMCVFDCCMNELRDKVSDVISFKNGTYFLKSDNRWKFYSKTGCSWGGLADVDIDRHGIILGKESPTQRKFLPMGRFDEDYVLVIQEHQTVVTNGERTISVVNERFNSINILK